MKNHRTLLVSIVVACLSLFICKAGESVAFADDKSTALLQQFLREAKIEKGIEEFEKLLSANPNDDSLKASIGILRFVHAIEGLGQAYYRFGLNPQRSFAIVGVMQLPVDRNPEPDKLSYADARTVFQEFLARLNLAEQALSGVQPSEIKIPLDVGQIFLDINRDGKASSSESFMAIMSPSLGMGLATKQPLSVVFAFDDADISWLRGYVNVLAGTTEVVLAYEWRDAFERVGHLLFEEVDSPYTFLQDERDDTTSWTSNQVLDLIALIHVINFDLIEPKRMPKALEHFDRVIELSRDTWKLIYKETDNDREWIPGPEQTSIVTGNLRGGRMGADWKRVLDQADLVLKGKELLPFWRGFKGGNPFIVFGNNSSREFKIHPTLGVNLRKCFTEPQRFDAVLWLQGTGVAPFLEEGKTIDMKAWQSLSESFQGRLPFFAFWIN